MTRRSSSNDDDDETKKRIFPLFLSLVSSVSFSLSPPFRSHFYRRSILRNKTDLLVRWLRWQFCRGQIMVRWKWHECLQVRTKALLLISRVFSTFHTVQSMDQFHFWSGVFFFQARLNDRDEIRRKLAAGNESEGENDDYYTSDYIKKTMVTTSHRRRQGEEIFYQLAFDTWNRSVRFPAFEWKSSHQSWLVVGQRKWMNDSKANAKRWDICLGKKKKRGGGGERGAFVFDRFPTVFVRS